MFYLEHLRLIKDLPNIYTHFKSSARQWILVSLFVLWSLWKLLLDEHNMPYLCFHINNLLALSMNSIRCVYFPIYSLLSISVCRKALLSKWFILSYKRMLVFLSSWLVLNSDCSTYCRFLIASNFYSFWISFLQNVPEAFFLAGPARWAPEAFTVLFHFVLEQRGEELVVLCVSILRMTGKLEV